MRERLMAIIPGSLLAALSWLLFWALLVTELD